MERVIVPPECKLDAAAVDKKLGGVFQQTLVDRAEFLDAEACIINANDLAAVRMTVEAERTKTAEQHVIAKVAISQRADGLAVEKTSSQRRYTDLFTGASRLELAVSASQRSWRRLSAR